MRTKRAKKKSLIKVDGDKYIINFSELQEKKRQRSRSNSVHHYKTNSETKQILNDFHENIEQYRKQIDELISERKKRINSITITPYAEVKTNLDYYANNSAYKNSVEFSKFFIQPKDE
jgi:hypothetical protein